MAGKQSLDVNGTKVDVTNLDKIFYPKAGFTKGDVIDYYVRISSVLLPHLKDRPITLKRYPDGVEGFFFYEKKCPTHRPAWVKTTKVAKSEGGEINYCVINDLPSLIWAANLADLELHTFLHKAPSIHRPTARCPGRLPPHGQGSRAPRAGPCCPSKSCPARQCGPGRRPRLSRFAPLHRWRQRPSHTDRGPHNAD